MADIAARVEKAGAIKAEGNAAFQAGNFKKAVQQYKMVYFHIGTLGSEHKAHRAIMDKGMGADSANGAGMAAGLGGKKATDQDAGIAPELQKAVDETLATTYSNLAMASINLQRWDAALAACEISLLYSPGNPKVIYRRGLVYHGKGMVDEAIAAFELTLSLQPGDGPATQRLAEAQAAAAAQRAKQKEAMKRMFAGVSSGEEAAPAAQKDEADADSDEAASA